MRERVKIGTCSGPAEAAFVRSVFDAHELPVVINGEMHASAMGGLGGFIGLEIFVDREDAEEATALLRDVRAGEHAVAEDSELAEGAHADLPGDEAHEQGDERADAEGVWGVKRAATAVARPDPPGAVKTAGPDPRRRRTGVVLLLSVIPGFGAAHMSTGAWGRGVAIAILNVIGVAYLARDVSVGGWLLFGARFIDLLGALGRVWSRPAGDRG